ILILVAVTLMTEIFSRRPVRAAAAAAAERNTFAEATRRNAEVVQAMGMARRMVAVWDTTGAKYTDANQRAVDIGVDLAATSRTLRLLVQSLVLAIGAYLVIE